MPRLNRGVTPRHQNARVGIARGRGRRMNEADYEYPGDLDVQVYYDDTYIEVTDKYVEIAEEGEHPLEEILDAYEEALDYIEYEVTEEQEEEGYSLIEDAYTEFTYEDYTENAKTRRTGITPKGAFARRNHRQVIGEKESKQNASGVKGKYPYKPHYSEQELLNLLKQARSRGSRDAKPKRKTGPVRYK